MTKKTKLTLLTGILVVTAAAAIGVSLSEESREEIRESGEVVFELPADTATSLSWSYTDASENDVSLAFHKDETWLYDSDEAFPVDEEAIQTLLDQFSQLRAAFVIEDVTDYAQYGLEDPTCTIDITAGGTDYEILVGNYSELDNQRYLSLGDGNVYLVNEDPMDVYEAVLDDFLLHDDIPIFTDVESAAFSGVENHTVQKDEDGISYREEDVYYLDGSPLDTDKVDSYLSHLSGMSLDGYATYKAAESDLTDYGLDDPELRITVTCRDDASDEDESTTVSVSRSPADRETPWADVLAALESEEDSAAAEYEDAVAYLRVDESTIIYEISYDDLQQILACSYNDFRHSEVLPADFSHVQSLEITLDGQDYTFTRMQVSDTEDASAWSFNDEEVDISDVEDTLAGLSISSFTEETGGEAEISLTAVLDLEENPEVQITLRRVDGETCLALVDGESVGYIPRSQAIDLIEAVHAIVLN